MRIGYFNMGKSGSPLIEAKRARKISEALKGRKRRKIIKQVGNRLELECGHVVLRDEVYAYQQFTFCEDCRDNAPSINSRIHVAGMVIP